MTTDIIIVTIKSLNLPRLEDDVIAEAEYSPMMQDEQWHSGDGIHMRGAITRMVDTR